MSKTLYDLLNSNFDDLEKNLKQVSSIMRDLHEKDYYIYNFDLSRIYLENEIITKNSFNNVICRMNTYQNANILNIIQLCIIILQIYSKVILNIVINQELFNYIRDNLPLFNKNNNIPDYIYEYLEEVFVNNHYLYFDTYLNNKKIENDGNTQSFRKRLATNTGKLLIDDNDTGKNAYLQVLFIPSIIAMSFIITLLMYAFILK